MKCPYWRLMNLWHPQDFLSISDRRRPPARPHADLLRAPDPSRRPVCAAAHRHLTTQSVYLVLARRGPRERRRPSWNP
jgi:hypothetical protein